MIRRRDKPRRGRKLAALAVVGLVCLGLVGCEQRPGDASKEEEPKVERQKLEPAEWSPPEPINLVEPKDADRREYIFSEPEKYPSCRELFEPEGEPLETFLPEAENPALTLAGCDPEAVKVRDGKRYVAYGLPHGDSEARDLRFVAYDDQGELMWSHRMDRSQYTNNFNANFRESFIALMPPQLACVGTLWEGGTQASCIELKNGKPRWAGEMTFWSGIPLQALETSLIGADISGMTRRYPYSGVEMRRVDYEHIGGHSALYITDGERLFYAPKIGKPQQLTAYPFESFEPAWRLKLPDHPDPGYNEWAFAEHGVVVIKIKNELFGIDSESGEIRWTWTVGDDRPPIAASPDRLHLLLRRAKKSNLLFALDPKSGEIDWYGPVPTGTLELSWVDGKPLLRSIHAIQRVLNADE